LIEATIMKKLIYFAIFMLAIGFNSCSKDEIGGTATEALAGQWYVRLNVVNADGSITIDPEGYGKKTISTYNTSDNSPSQMWVSDQRKFKNFAVKVKCDAGTLTFSSDGEAANKLNDNIKVTIINGQILRGAGRQYNGSPADSIVFDAKFSNAPATTYRFTGIRYSGLVENED
jgi:hypothetical protein